MSTLPPESVPPPAPFAGVEHDALPAGTRFGEFEILRVLGVGGFGIVYLAYDHSLEREVALKEYMPASLAARGAGPQITVRSSSFAETYAIGLRSFINEARLLARFDHPSLVKVYRFWEDNATAYMVMPFLQGTTLRDTRRRMPHPPDEAWIRSVVTPILAALELLHREGVFHRDIAPDNILLQEEGPPILLDFGAARRVISDRTQSLTAILKPSYAPIEQYAEMAQMRQGPWTDLYALGAVIHYLLFGAPPPPATARAVQDGGDAFENRIVPGVSPQFLEAMGWMLTVRPNQRPQSGEELRAVLDGGASVPPRGRPGITIPPHVANPPTAAPAVQGLPGGIEPAHDATRISTGYVPTHLPTAHVLPPGQQPTRGPLPPAAPPTFNPAEPMPTARPAGAASTDPAASVAPPGNATRTIPPPRTQPPPATRAVPPGHVTRPPSGAQQTVPPPAAGAHPSRTQPPGYAAPPPSGRTQGPTSAAVPRQTRPAPLAGAVAPPPAMPAKGSSKAASVIAAVAVVLVIGAVLAWQLAGNRGGAAAVDAAASAASENAAVADNAAASSVPASVIETPPTPPVAVAVPQAPAPASSPLAAATPAPDATVSTSAAQVDTTASAALASTPRVEVRERPNAAAAALAASAAAASSGARTRVARDGASAPTVSRQPDGSIGPIAGSASRPLGQPSVRDAYTSATPGTGARPPVTTPAVPVAEAPAPASARDACGGRVFIALAICMEEKCDEARWRNTGECQRILTARRQRENR